MKDFLVSAVKPVTVGGQAVIEGVMMRGANGYAVAVRRANGEIEHEATPHVPLARRYPLLRLPIVRGAVGLIEMMSIGMKTLEYSAQKAALDDPTTAKDGKTGGDEPPMSKMAIALTMITSLSIGLFIFAVIPNIATHWVGKLLAGGGDQFLEENSPIAYNLISGFIRMLIIVGYMWAISLMPDIKRLFRYHGAEHKAVSAFEAGKELTVENVRPFTIFHPRCGTTFIAITLIVAILTFAVFAKILVAVWPTFADYSFAVRKTILIIGHILIMPIVAGICFELLRLGGKYTNNILLKILIAPGFLFQRLTVKEPDDSMIEVAIFSLKKAMALPEAVPAAVTKSEAAAVNVASPA